MPTIVQEAQPLDHAREPLRHVLDRHAVRIFVEHLGEALAGDEFHDHPVVAVGVRFDVEDRHQVGMFQIEALRNAAQLDVEVLLEQLERDFLAGVGEGVIHLAEAAPVDGPLDGVAVERFRFGLKCELHGFWAVRLRFLKLAR